ncbi:MAG: CRISPR-associated RAMP family protein [Chloroflexota bacterium]|nr:TIGR03986 family CRISPR-associated RAMP protein [Caldilinea sp.]GIK75183.1 MAG: CRISPR-associated RAMP family protein [Chloroflexota bacterium]
MWPKHDNPQYKRRAHNGEEYRATAPYNFVPLPDTVRLVEQPIPGHDNYLRGFTGYFDCTLTTLTPLYTRTALKPEFFEQWGDDLRKLMKDPVARETYAQFFHIDNVEEPLIPGSTLRGMVRALIEIASSGKSMWVSNEKLFYRTVDNSTIGKEYSARMTGKVKGGILRKNADGYYIEECVVLRVQRDKLGGPNALYDGTAPNKRPKWTNSAGAPHQYAPVWVRVAANGWAVEDIRYSTTKGFRGGRLVITGDIPRKQKEFVFLDPAPNTAHIAVSEELIHQLQSEHQITQWQENAFPTDKPTSGSRSRPGMLRSDKHLEMEGDPVFYLIEGNTLVFLGRAQMFRLPYNHSPLDMVPGALRSHLQDGQEVFDLAEAMFGYAPEKGANGERKSSRAGRVYFGDARFAEARSRLWWSDEPVTPKILGSPKPTAFQHYLVQNRQRRHDPDQKDRLAHYGTPTPTETIVRGHKLYWHKQSVVRNRAEIKEENNVPWESDTQHTQIRPVSDGVTFKFRVHFENLLAYEVGALLWALTLPGGASEQYRHKIGMGKALGLGSVAISAVLHLTERGVSASSADHPAQPEKKGRYEQLFAGQDWHRAERQTTDEDNKEFLKAFAGFAVGQPDTKVFLADSRIRLLLTMLRWPGPSADDTQTMSLEAFKVRPVLPTPDHIGDRLLSPGGQGRSGGPANARTTGRFQSERRTPEATPSPPRGQQELASERRKPLDAPTRKVIEPGVQGRQLEANLKARFVEKQGAEQQPEPIPATKTPVAEPARVIAEPQSIQEVEKGMLVRATVTEVRFDAIRFEIGAARLPGTMLESRVIPKAKDVEELSARFPIGAAFELWVLNVNKKGNVQLAMQKP